jgi:hypothetical protein
MARRTVSDHLGGRQGGDFQVVTWTEPKLFRAIGRSGIRLRGQEQRRGDQKE